MTKIFKPDKFTLPEVFVYILLLGIAIIPRLFFFVETDGAWEIDSLGRISTTLKWMDNPDAKPPATQGFFYFYILKLFLMLWNRPFLTPMIMGLVTGLIFVILYYETLKLIYDRKILKFW